MPEVHDRILPFGNLPVTDSKVADHTIALPERAGNDEAARIREAYARRKTSVPGDRYSCFNAGNLVIEQELERKLLSAMTRAGAVPLAEKRVLEVGCGHGARLRNLVRWGASPRNLFGIDLLEERIGDARRLLPQEVTLRQADATRLEFPGQSFDLILQFTVFSSILEAETKQKVADEMLRLLRPEGSIIWYDFFLNNPQNPDVRGIRKQEIERLFAGCQVRAQRLTLAPPLARSLGPCSVSLCQMLSAMKLFSTHYLAVVRKLSGPPPSPPHSAG